jgi:hypothetical protein
MSRSSQAIARAVRTAASTDAAERGGTRTSEPVTTRARAMTPARKVSHRSGGTWASSIDGMKATTEPAAMTAITRR